MKYLLIDDWAQKGWARVLEKSVIKQDNSLDVVLSYEEALLKIQQKWSLIFLDMRLTEEDHNCFDFSNCSGFKILKKIKDNFSSVNFSTPVVLITASNKIWNINSFMEYGIDGFYIKEHPEWFFDQISSRENLENLQNTFLRLKSLGAQRNQIWSLCDSIINELNKHSYFNGQNLKYLNVKRRIIDKIKLGYTQLFQEHKTYVKLNLLNFNESLSFIIFWSILEEISKGFTDYKDTWDEIYNRKVDWKFRNKEHFILFDKNKLEINIKKRGEDCVKGLYKIDSDSEEYKKYFNKKLVNLSDQIFSLLSAYCSVQEFNVFSVEFKRINKFRNEIDFIHSSVKAIYEDELIGKKDREKAYDMNVNVLELINKLLKIKI